MFELSRTPSRTFESDLFWPGAFLRSLANEATPVRGWMPPVDIFETQEAFRIQADLPGVAKGDVQINVEKNVLTLSGERVAVKQEGTWHRNERAYGKFSRSFTLPVGIDAEGIQASFENGLLTLTVPKKQEARSRQIEIQ